MMYAATTGPQIKKVYRGKELVFKDERWETETGI